MVSVDDDLVKILVADCREAGAEVNLNFESIIPQIPRGGARIDDTRYCREMAQGELAQVVAKAKALMGQVPWN